MTLSCNEFWRHYDLNLFICKPCTSLYKNIFLNITSIAVIEVLERVHIIISLQFVLCGKKIDAY